MEGKYKESKMTREEEKAKELSVLRDLYVGGEWDCYIPKAGGIEVQQLNINEEPKLQFDTQSLLPLPDEILKEKRQRMMRVEIVNIKHSSGECVKTFFELRNNITGEFIGSLYGAVCEIDDSRVIGYLPSKIWYEDISSIVKPLDCALGGVFNLLYYVNDTLPVGIKPFSDKMYLFWSYLDPLETLMYDIDIRMFMDQIKFKDDMVYIMIFDEANYKLIVDRTEDV